MPFPIQHVDDEGNVDVDALGEALDDRQFTAVWEPRGWRRVDPATAAAAELTGEVKALGDHTVAELLALAAHLGVAGVTSSSRKAQIIEAIEAHAATEEDQ
jgi:hypothetical protein